MKRRNETVLDWEPKKGREKRLKAFARMLEQKSRKKKGGNRHGL